MVIVILLDLRQGGKSLFSQSETQFCCYL